MSEIIITDIAGRGIQRESVQARTGTMEIPISTEGWAAGTYLVNLRSGEKQRIVRVVVIQ